MPFIGENTIKLNQETMRDILAESLNRKTLLGADIKVTDVYYEANSFVVVTQGQPVPAEVPSPEVVGDIGG